MNKVVIMGRMAAEPELRQTGTGIAVTNFTMAVDRQYSKDKERHTDWVDVVVWKGTAEFVCKYFHKGDPIVVEGSLQTRLWEDKNGQKRKTVEVQAENVEFVLRQSQKNGENEKPAADNGNSGFLTDDNDDYPF